MSQELIGRSQDLKRLQDEGYEIEVKNGYSLIHHVPYVNADCKICYGTLVSNLTLAGDITVRPDTHVIYFAGEHPCNKDGSIITGIRHASYREKELTEGVIVNHSFSNKPSEGFSNYYDKFVSYINIITASANSIDNSVTAKTFNEVETSCESVFYYSDTNTSRAEIGSVSKILANHKVAIVGLGGTGSYILDLVAKTPVAEIHLFDGDDFLQHNAFRAPGAPSIDVLKKKQKKTDYLCDIYKNMHKYIFPHNEFLNSSNIEELLSMDFVFVCIDKGEIKKDIINKLIQAYIPFIDTGMGIHLIDDSLIGTIRITACTPQKNEHINKRISFVENEDNEYSTNIQIADLNSLNAVLAVVKWKKLMGFYQDITREHHTTYTINDGEIINEDK